MKLKEYVGKVLDYNAFPDKFPNKLVISRDLAAAFHRMYKDGERKAHEFGCNLFYRNDDVMIGDNVFEGISGSVHIEKSEDRANFGDYHCHPSASIGHMNGYSAHSPEDFLGIEEHLSKCVFIRFVSSGDHVYAVVYRNGLSKFVKNYIDNRSIETKKHNEVYFDDKCKGVTREERNEAMLSMNNSKEQEIYMNNLKRKIPSLGKTLQKRSIEDCRYLSRALTLGFYRGKKGIMPADCVLKRDDG